VFDYGGVIGTPVERYLVEFEAQQGYPRGALMKLLFGEDVFAENPEWTSDTPSVSHNWHRLETGELDILAYIDDARIRAPEVIGREFDIEAFAVFMAEVPIGVFWPAVHRIRALREEGLALGLLTNNIKEFGSTWRSTFPVVDLFDVVVDSSEVGMRKPDPRIYEYTCEQLGIAPDAAVFLDDLPVNIAAARSVGMETVRVDEDILTAIAELDAILARRGTGVRSR